MSNYTIESLWNAANVELDGNLDEHTSEAIGRDQAVDDDGLAIYPSYTFILENGEKVTFAAEDMEAFARTW